MSGDSTEKPFLLFSFYQEKRKFPIHLTSDLETTGCISIWNNSLVALKQVYVYIFKHIHNEMKEIIVCGSGVFVRVIQYKLWNLSKGLYSLGWL